MVKPPAFQFYPKDWLSSRRTLMMTPAQEGAYIRLLCYCWDSGDCSLPDDDQELAVMSRLGEGWLNGGSSVVRKCFIPHPTKPGFLSNERLLDEADKQGAWREKSSAGGKASAAKRAENKAKSKGRSRVVEPAPNRPAEPKGNTASASSSASADKDSGTEVPSSPPLPEWLPRPEWESFRQSRKKLKAPMTEAAERLSIRDLERLRADGHDPKAVLEQSIKRGWKGLFPLKDEHQPKGQQHGRHAGFEQQDYFAGTEGFEVIGGSNGTS